MHSSILLAVDLDRVVERVERALGRAAPAARPTCRWRRRDRTPAASVGDDGLDRRGGAERRADDDVHRRAVELARCGMPLGRRRAGTTAPTPRSASGRADPELQAVAAVRAGRQVLGRALGVDDAAPGRHPVDGAGLDPLDHAGRVAMHHRAVEQVGERRQADVRMRADVVVGAGRDVDRAEVVEEHERPDRAPVAEGRRRRTMKPPPRSLVCGASLQGRHVFSEDGAAGGRGPRRLRGERAHVAAFEVVVDQAHRLHERVDRGRADEAPAALLQVLRHRHRFGRAAELLQRRQRHPLRPRARPGSKRQT